MTQIIEVLKKKVKPENIQEMDLFDYKKRINEFKNISLGQLNQSRWLITNEDGSETWIGIKQFTKILDLYNWNGISLPDTPNSNT